MMFSDWRSRVFLIACLTFPAIPTYAQDTTEKSRTLRSILDHSYPRLVLVMTFDQLRGDHLTRYSNHFLPAHAADGQVGGFRWLMENGAVMADAHYNHLPLHTGPGHATIMTGAAPRRSGIIGNAWYTTAGLTMNCVHDPDVRPVGIPVRPNQRGSFSPKNLLAETVGDNLKFSNNRQSKVVGIGIKDRGAILPAGHDADAAIWFDATQGKWITSTWYTDSGLPTFAQRANDSKIADRWIGQEWDYLLPEPAYRISQPEGFEGYSDTRGYTSDFPKFLSEPGSEPNRDYYNALVCSPFGNEMVLETAKLAVEYEELGQDLYPDILAVSFSTTDIVGHQFGPYSREVQDVFLRADRQVADFLNFLHSSIPGGLDSVLIAVSSDHGVAPIPSHAATRGFPAKRMKNDDYVSAAREALSELYPGVDLDGIVLYSDPYLSFRQPAVQEAGIDIETATDAIAARLKQLDGVSTVFTRKQIETGQLPHTRDAQLATNGFNPDRAGEIIVLTDQFVFTSGATAGTTHGTGYNYDTHVPIIFAGTNIRAGVFTERSDVRDIAPTISFLLGLSAPASSEGRILTEIIR